MDATSPSSPTDPLPDSWSTAEEGAPGGGRRRILAIVLVAVAVLAVVGAAAAYVSGRFEPEERAWPDLGGRPEGLGATGQATDAVDPTVDPGAYLWNDFDGWHLWVVNGDGVRDVEGTITSTDEIGRAQLSAPDTGTVATDGKVVAFTLDGDVAVAGVDFEPGFYAKRIEVDLRGPDGPLDPALVIVGGEPAAALPVAIDKQVVED
jgi:hypothetical protein